MCWLPQNLRFNINTTDLEDDQQQTVAPTDNDGDSEDDSSDELEDETIAPSPQHTLVSHFKLLS